MVIREVAANEYLVYDFNLEDDIDFDRVEGLERH
jgi:hypothetical protein